MLCNVEKYTVLNKLETLDDIKKLNLKELEALAVDVRNYMVEVCSENGGHLAASLGVVELTIALLLSFDVTKDKIIWDVGHQSYAYKILTDRKEAFKTLRKYGGISGFPKRNESLYDAFDTGHSSTSISAGLGMAEARELNGEKYNVISIIGDGALTGGMAFEALNNVSNLKGPFIIILNDNEMSISKSIGGINKALLGVRSSTSYRNFKNMIKDTLEKTGIGITIKNNLIKCINAIKQLIVTDGMFFENLNINYVGPVDGHNIKQLVNTLMIAKTTEEPIVIHIKTKKGKGYKLAEENPTYFHGIAPFNIETGELKNKSNVPSYTKMFSNELINLATKNDKIVAITAAMKDGTGLTEFAEKFTDRFFDVGICEQHAVTFAAGLATSNIIPVVCIYSTFLQRAFDQVVHDVCMQNLHVVFAIDRAGLVGADGETHQGMLDISYLRLIPNMTILAPKNGVELQKMLDFAVNEMTTPVAIRYPRGAIYDGLTEYDEKIVYGKSEIIYNGKDIAIFALGTTISTAVHISDKLKKKNINVTLVNARFAKPIDYDMIDYLCGRHKKLVVMEEGVANGGIGQDIAEYIEAKKYNVEVLTFATQDIYIGHGTIDELRAKIGMDSESIIQKIEKV